MPSAIVRATSLPQPQQRQPPPPPPQLLLQQTNKLPKDLERMNSQSLSSSFSSFQLSKQFVAAGNVGGADDAAGSGWRDVKGGAAETQTENEAKITDGTE